MAILLINSGANVDGDVSSRELNSWVRPVHDVLLLVLLGPFGCPFNQTTFGRPFEKGTQKDAKGWQTDARL